LLLPFFNKNYIEAGVDEAGRGCLAGPVVAAAVILPKDYEHKLLNDSKQLTKKDRETLRDVIKEDALAYAIGIASNQEIDQINILKASILAMHRAIEDLKNTLCPEHLLIDGNRFYPFASIPHTCLVKGDARFLSIAAASILAKTYRDDLMEGLSSEYPIFKWNENAGYPTIHHRKMILEHGPTPYHRLTFKVRI
jgi:ribonuclease HII